MNVAIYKVAGDGRRWTCGVQVYDDQVLVVEMSLAKQTMFKQLEAFGYIVEETTLAPGYYDQAEYTTKGVEAAPEAPRPPERGPGKGGEAVVGAPLEPPTVEAVQEEVNALL